MSLYELPKFESVGKAFKKPEIENPSENSGGAAPPEPKSSQPVLKSQILGIIILTIFISSAFGFLAGAISGNYLPEQVKEYISRIIFKAPEQKENIQIQSEPGYVPQTSQEEAVIKAVNENSPAVVSIIITKDLPVIEEYYTNPFGPLFPEIQIPQYRQQGTQKQEVGGGTGFIISEDGMILTNKHVVLDEEAEYTVLTNDGKNFPARVLAKDPVQDIAIIKIEQEKIVDGQGAISFTKFPVVKLGDSDILQIGQSVITIGNALGEYRNTVSVGVISGLSRTVTASGGGLTETIEDVIQTDAAINPGNSGGPLLNLKGEVIGMNTAIAQDAQSIGFTIPINKAKRDIEQVKSLGRIAYPFLGVRYVLITDAIQKEEGLSVNYGAWIQKGEGGEAAVTPGSAAEKAGLKNEDIILEFNGEKISAENTLAKIIEKYNPGDKVNLKILRGGKEMTVELILGERNE